MKEDSRLPHYEFSDKYDPKHAKQYFEKHHASLGDRFITWRETAMVREALAMAGRPSTVLDLPCGTGRFWALLAEEPERRIYAADNSQAMIDEGLRMRPPAVTSRLAGTYQCSAFATGLPDKFVQCVCSIRLMHHIEKSEDRILMLKEFARVSADTVIVTLWVDGNFGAWQRARLEERRRRAGKDTGARNRLVIPRAQFEREIAAAGLQIVGHVDFLKRIDKKRAYVLRVPRA